MVPCLGWKYVCGSRLLTSVWCGQHPASIYTCSFLYSFIFSKSKKSQGYSDLTSLNILITRCVNFWFHLFETFITKPGLDISNFHRCFKEMRNISSVRCIFILFAVHEFDDSQNIERLFWKFMQILRIFLLVLKLKLTRLDTRYLLLN